MIVGLTGGMAAGKSTVSAYLKKKGYPVVDADAISHELTAPDAAGTKAVAEAFGEEFAPGGVLDRAKLAAWCFEDPVRTEQLNGVLHPLIVREMRARTPKDGLCFWDVPLLFESGLENLCDRTVTLVCPKEIRIRRARERDGLTRREVLARLSRQWPDREKKRKADYAIDSRGTEEETLRKIDRLLEELT